MIEIAGKRYSQAMFEASLEENKIDLIFDQLNSLKELVNQNHNFFKMLEFPMVTLNEKFATIDEIFGSAYDYLVCDMLKLLVEKSRIALLKKIIEDYEELYYEHKKITKVNVTSAYELSDSEREDLKSSLEDLLKQSVVLYIKIDKSLIGGLFIKAKDIIIDASVKGKLEKMKSNLINDDI